MKHKKYSKTHKDLKFLSTFLSIKKILVRIYIFCQNSDPDLHFFHKVGPATLFWTPYFPPARWLRAFPRIFRPQVGAFCARALNPPVIHSNLQTFTKKKRLTFYHCNAFHSKIDYFKGNRNTWWIRISLLIAESRSRVEIDQIRIRKKTPYFEMYF